MKLFKISVKWSRAGFQLLQEETAGPPAALRSARGPLSPYKLTACAWPLGPSRPTQQPPLARPEHSRAWPRPRFSETRKSRLPYSPGVPAEGSPRATRAPSGWPLSSACAWLLSETWLLRERGGGTKSRVGGGAVARIQDLWEEVTSPAPGLGYPTPPYSPTCHWGHRPEEGNDVSPLGLRRRVFYLPPVLQLLPRRQDPSGSLRVGACALRVGACQWRDWLHQRKAYPLFCHSCHRHEVLWIGVVYWWTNALTDGTKKARSWRW